MEPETPPKSHFETISLLTKIMVACVVIGLVVVSLNVTKRSVRTLQLTSSAFIDGEPIPAQYTCFGRGLNPPLDITGPPLNAKSLTLIVDDPDAPGGTFTHWIVWNIPTSTDSIMTGLLPDGATSGTNDNDKTGYYAPCPPSGTHHYRFILYALNTTLSLTSSAKPTDLTKAMAKHILTEAELDGTVAANH